MLQLRIVVFAFMLFVLTCARAQVPAPDTPPPEFTAQDRADILAQIHSYFAILSAGQYDSFPAYVQAPFLTYGREPTITTSLDEVLARYRRLRESLNQVDYSLSKAANIRLTPQTPMHALADVHWQRFKKDGSLLDEGAEIMVLNKTSGTWKIAGMLPQQLKYYGER